MNARPAAPRWLTALAIVVAVAAVGFTEWRLWQGMDLADESYYVAVPYRFSVGARPFVDETGVLQVPTFLVYPFVKPFVELQGGSGDGIMMYTRHLYLLFMCGVSAAVFFALRRRLRWQYALMIAAVYVSFVLFDLTQLSYNTMGAGFLTLGVACGLLGLWRGPAPPEGGPTEAAPATQRAAARTTVAGERVAEPATADGRGAAAVAPATQRAAPRAWSWWFAAAGLAHGLAGWAFPTLWAMAVLFAVLLGVCAWLERRWAIERTAATGSTADPSVAETGPAAAVTRTTPADAGEHLAREHVWHAPRRGRSRWLPPVLGYAAAVAAVAIVEAAVVLSFGWSNVQRSLDFSFSGAKQIDQVGGFPKLGEVLSGIGRFVWSRPYLVIAALLLYLIYRIAPRVGRGLLVLLPVPLYLAGQRALLETAGFAIMLALLTPYLFLFLPARRRRPATTLLLWAGVPGILGAVLTGWTSAEGYPHAALGAMPALMTALAFLVWALLNDAEPGDEAAGVRTRDADAGPSATARRAVVTAGDWLARHGGALAAVALTAIVAICIVFQFQQLARNVSYSELTVWMDSGPYWGIHTTAQRKAYLDQFERDLAEQSTPEDRLLVYPQFVGAYMYWPYRTATDTVWVGDGPTASQMPSHLREWLEQTGIVPTLVVHTVGSDDLSDAEFHAQYSEELEYPIVLRRPNYTFLRRPAGYTPPFMRRE